MNGVSLSTSVSYVAPQSLENTQATERSPNTATLTITLAGGGAQGANPLSFQLSYPLVDMSDISINELTQQLESLGLEGFQLTATANAALQMLSAVHSYASGVVAGGREGAEANAASIAMAFGSIEQAFGNLEQSISKMLDSGDYPDYASFLKLVLRTSQEIREMASEVRQAALKGEFENIIAQADMMRSAATKRHDAAMDEIEAARTEATGKIISGSVGIVTTVAFGFAGNAQVGAAVGTSLSSIIDGTVGHMTADLKQTAEGKKKAAEFLDAARKEMEAAQKLLGESQDVAKELGDIAKQLRDMVLNLYKDFISNQNQIIQRANI